MCVPERDEDRPMLCPVCLDRCLDVVMIQGEAVYIHSRVVTEDCQIVAKGCVLRKGAMIRGVLID